MLAFMARRKRTVGSVDAGRLGAHLRALRLARDLSQGELAERTALGQSDISKIENGRLPSLPQLAAICAVLRVRTERVLATAEGR
jgi:transcriptional regulator with XRE-family HTH domain